ncbi:MAG: DNA topoisomerase IV subunit A [Micrococcaceae bacterium]
MLSNEQIHDIDVTDEMETSYLEYAYSVIFSRALPDARDGLKPVQRRILYMMDEMGLNPDKGHVKSARVIGEVMGKLHPHGDSAIYDALVRMSQDFSLRLPLIDGHGNFGSLDDGPAASRYTEARLAPAALLMTQNLDEDVVDFVPNYDNQIFQPEVLPAAYPNLLVNGASGIAVGMATNMAPHNLNETIAGAIHLLENPDAATEDLMRFIPGPDLPTGGKIIGLSGIKEAYETGRGSFKTRAKAEITKITARKNGITFTELPYSVGPEKIIARTKVAVQQKKIQGISDIIDLTDRKKGTQLVVELKAGYNPQAVLEQLYRHTPLEESFGINNVVLVDGQPQTLGLKDLLSVYVKHRLSVVQRRANYRFKKKQDRLHLVDGLLLAMIDIDKVIAIIRESDEAKQARKELQDTFELSEIQANYILDLRLRQLTKFSKIELEKEKKALLREIAKLKKILDSETELRNVVISELREVAEEHATARRTILMESENSSVKSAEKLELKIKDNPCFVLLSASGQLARTQEQTLPDDPFHNRAAHDVLLSVLPATVRGKVAAITNQGRMIRLEVIEFPVLPNATQSLQVAGGAPTNEFIDLKTNEHIIGIVNLEDDDAGIVLGTKQGIVKRVTVGWPVKEDEWEVITLKEDDEILNAISLPDSHYELVFITQNAQLLHYSANIVRPQGRSGAGVAGIKLAKNDNVIFFGAVNPERQNAVLTITAKSSERPHGSAKLSDFTEFPSKGRATLGVKAQRFLSGETKLQLAYVGQAPLLTANINSEPVEFINDYAKRDASGTTLEFEISEVGPNLAANSTPVQIASDTTPETLF